MLRWWLLFCMLTPFLWFFNGMSWHIMVSYLSSRHGYIAMWHNDRHFVKLSRVCFLILKYIVFEAYFLLAPKCRVGAANFRFRFPLTRERERYTYILCMRKTNETTTTSWEIINKAWWNFASWSGGARGDACAICVQTTLHSRFSLY